MPGEGLRALASVFGVNAEYLLKEDGPVPEPVKAELEKLKKRKRAEVREFAAKALDVVDPGTFEQIARVLAEGPLALEAPEHDFNRSPGISISSSRTSFQSSELSRASAEVFAAAVERPVRVIRRDGEPLLLMSETVHRERSLLMELSAQLLFAPAENEVSLVNRMGDKLPWMLALGPAERDTCATNIVTAVRASLATDQPRRALTEVASWREMAVAAAANHGRKPAEDLGGELQTLGSAEGQSATTSADAL